MMYLPGDVLKVKLKLYKWYRMKPSVAVAKFHSQCHTLAKEKKP